MHPQSFQRLAPVISAVEREAPAWFGGPVDAITPEHHVERATSDVLLLRVRTRTRTAGVSLRIWRALGEREQDRRRVEERVRREFQVTLDCWHAFRDDSTAGCVRPLAYFPEHLAIATEEAPGRPLDDLLARVLVPFASKADRLTLDRACDGLAAWLRRFQAVGAAEEALAATELTEYIDARLRRLVGNPMAGFSASDRVHVLLVTAWLIGRLQPEERVEVPIHGELTPAKIVLDDRQLTVVECTSGRRGLALHDLASVHIHMHVGIFGADHRYSAALIREVQRKFLQAFDPTLDLQRPAFRVALLVNVVNHYALLAAQRSASVAALSDWRVMRRHRSWLRRLEQTAHGAVASR
jgi:hypothetical protein